MRCESNAVPAAGRGLKVIASGTIRAEQSVTLPGAAAFAFLVPDVFAGSSDMTNFVIAIADNVKYETSGGEYAASLSKNGRTFTDSSSNSSQHRYLAFG